MKNTVSQEDINRLVKKSRRWVQHRVFDKLCILVLELPNGFTVTSSSACVDPDNYDDRVAEKICMRKIEDKLLELEGYLLQEQLYTQE